MLRILWGPLLLVTAVSGTASAYDFSGHSTFTAGLGAGVPAGRFAQYDRFLVGPALSLDYEFRLHRYFAADAGLDLVFRTDNEQCFSPHGCPPPTPAGKAWLVPFGARAILPLREGQVELFAGAGGAKVGYEKFDNQFLSSGWGGQANGGFRVGLGSGHRWKVGVLGRYYRIPDNAYLKEQWVGVSATVGVTF